MKNITKVAVVGSRGFDDYTLFQSVMNQFLDGLSTASFVSGGAGGADSMAKRYAEENGIEIIIYKPEWHRYGRGAGFVRNKKIWEEADMGIAFWDGISKGTQHSFKLAEQMEKKLLVYDYIKREFVDLKGIYEWSK